MRMDFQETPRFTSRNFDASKMNNTDSNNNSSNNLAYLIPVFLFLIFLLFLLLYWLSNSRYIRRKLGFSPENQLDLEQPLIPDAPIRKRDREGLLVKRCDQTSTRSVEDRIIDRLRGESRVNVWKRDADDGRRPVIVFCVISSRIGTDIENAMRGVHGNSPVILVLLHPVLPSLLRGDLSDDEELLDPAMRSRMSDIAHFAFSDREGLYDCQQNRLGFERLVDLARSLE